MNYLNADKSRELDQSFRIQKIENIEDYFVAIEENYPEFSSIDIVLKYLMDEIVNLDPNDYDHLGLEYTKVFGEKPEDPEEEFDYYQYSNSCVSFNVLFQGEIIFCVRFEFNVKEKKLDISNPQIEKAKKKFENKLSDCVKKINILIKK